MEVHNYDKAENEEFAGGFYCNCPDDCEDTIYQPELSQIALNVDASILGFVHEKGGEIYNLKKSFAKSVVEHEKLANKTSEVLLNLTFYYIVFK